MHLFGAHDWAARLPLALLSLALLLATYALGLRLFAAISPAHAPDRGALYAALALGTAIGPYLYTRFFIPDIVVTLWLTLAIHLFLLALERARQQSSTWAPMLGYAATLAASVLTKGFIGLLFPVAFAVLYLLVTRRLRLLSRLHLPACSGAFLVLALPWHVLVALRNPAIALPPGLGLPAHAGWAWFYLYNEHIARFLSRRIPHDYGQVPVPLFWALAAVWLIPWIAFLPGALAEKLRELRSGSATEGSRCQEAAVAPLLWIVLVLGFFTFSARQEYYSLPCLPAMALLIGGLLARSDRNRTVEDRRARASVQRWSTWFLLPFGALLGVLAASFAAMARPVARGTDISVVLAHSQDGYNLSLGHLSDLTPTAMGLFRWPLLLAALALFTLGPFVWLVRRSGRTVAANLALAAAATTLLLAVHAGLVRFYPILGSKSLARSILRAQASAPAGAADLILIDGELTAGSTLLFYTQEPVHLVNGRVNGPWYGSFWPDAPPIFETDRSLKALWSGPRRVFLLTSHPAERNQELRPFGQVHTLSEEGGKSILTNRP